MRTNEQRAAPSTRHKLINFAMYQLGWFCCVLGAAADHPWLGSLAVVVLVAIHLAWLPDPLAELKLLLSAALIGGIADSLQVSAGLLVFTSGNLSPHLAPPWILLMWVQFATLFRFGLSFLRGRFLLAALLAAVGGPFAFWSGARLGAMEFPQPEIRSLIVLGLVWAVAFPLLLWLSVRWIDVTSIGRYGRRR